MRLLLSLSLTCAVVANAQVPTRRLGPAEASFPEPFSAVTGFRVLRDGRAIIADSREQSLSLIDFASGEARPVGRKGAGPGEWGAPTTLYAMPGDSTLMSDFVNGRFLIILPDGRPGATFRLADENLGAVASLGGVDAQGNLFLERTRPPAQQGRGVGSTGIVDVYRYDRRSNTSSIVAQYATPAGEVSAARMLEGGMMQTSTNLPLAPRDATASVPGGEFIVVRAEPYRVDRIDVQGRVRNGSAAEPARVRVTTAEREAFVRSQIRPGAILVSGGGGAPTPTTGSGGERARPQIPTFSGDVNSLFSPDMRWPEFKPAFGSRAVVAEPSGRVWVQRSRAHDDPIPVYDVFDASGRAAERVSLAARSRVIGFGDAVVYVARTDEDDLIYVERHRLGGR
jgi:hypothetical protein